MNIMCHKSFTILNIVIIESILMADIHQVLILPGSVAKLYSLSHLMLLSTLRQVLLLSLFYLESIKKHQKRLVTYPKSTVQGWH